MRIKELTALRGVSGNEKDVREFILSIAKPLSDEITVDSMGNLIAFKKGTAKNPKKVMLAAHMDEVGFIVQYVRDDGLIRYLPIGGIDASVCVSKRVEVGENHVPGVLGAKAIHLQKPNERTEPFTHDALFIDIGAKDKKDALSKIKIGDYVNFLSETVDFGDGLVKSRALDDRIGCAILLELLQGRYDCDLYCAFTVQEEIGLNGAKVSGYRIDPDFGIAFEGTTANDTPGARVHEEICSVGCGPTVSFMDSASIANPKLFSSLCKLADSISIPWQLKRGVTGGNDAGAMQRAKGGAATAVISVPCRYIHSPASVASYSDMENALKLGKAFLENFGSLEL